MGRINSGLVLFIGLLSFTSSVNLDTINSGLVNKKVQRNVDLSTHLPKITTSITLENTGNSVAKSFLFSVEPTLKDYISYIGAVVKSSDEDTKLQVSRTSVSGHSDDVLYRIDLAQQLGAGKEAEIDVETIYAHSLTPYPSQITQAEKQLVKFVANAYFYSPYTTKEQETVVKCTTPSVESFTKVEPSSSSENEITYGPYSNKDGFSQKEISVHYENNSPFLAVSNLLRLVEVSHWGNIAVEETVDMYHTGAILKGPFSRYDYQRQQEDLSSIKSFKTVLPSSARDVYYRDEIGNISTSALRDSDDVVEVELKPRFPLFGGWKTHYYIGYNVPSYQYLYNSGDQYMVKMRFVDHIFDDQVIDDMTLKIILPEGSRDVQFKAPYDVDRSPDELHYTYLDTIGRPVVIVHKKNLVEGHIQDFELTYNFPRLLLLQEPLLVVSAFYLLFLVVIIYVRMDFSITKDEASESRMRVAGLIEQVQAIQDRRSALYQSYDDTINKYKASKDQASLLSSRKKIDADYKQLTHQIASLLTKLKTEGSDAVEKVTELQRADAQVKEHIGLVIGAAEKLIGGKMNKNQYVDTETTFKAKREELCQKMENILASL